MEEKSKNFHQKKKDFYEKKQKNISKGDIIYGTIVSVGTDSVYVDIGRKEETEIDRREFDVDPKVGERMDFLVKGAPYNVDSPFILSKKEAQEMKNWNYIKDCFQNNYQISGSFKKEFKNKGYIFDVKGFDFFLPASQIFVKKQEIIQQAKFEFKILRLDPPQKTGLVSHKKLLDEIKEEKWKDFQSKYKVGDKIIVKVKEIVSFGVFCMCENIRGLIYYTEISYKKNLYYREFKEFFREDEELEVIILEMDPEKNKLFFGLKQLEEDPWDWAKQELIPGTVIRGTVSHIVLFGAFVELKEGLEGLIHNTELSWSRKNQTAKQILKKGQIVEASVSSIDFEKRKLSLSLKYNQVNPWEHLSENIRVGNICEGKVTKHLDYAILVEAENEIEAFIHIGNISWEDNITKDDFPKVGEVVKYKILNIDTEKQKISCGLKQLIDHPYKILKKHFSYNSIVDVVVTGLSDNKIFVKFSYNDREYSGLIPNSEFLPEDKDSIRIGDNLKVSIVNINIIEKKIILSLKKVKQIKERSEMDKYMRKKDEIVEESIGKLVNKDEKI